MAMRVIAGEYRHRKLEYPLDNPAVRPTKDRIREAFFSSCGDINGKVFLDLCAGSGSIGIEAISRGAKTAIFVDNYSESLSCINKNIKSLGITNYTILPMDVINGLESIKNNGIKLDIIYFDPPYESSLYNRVLTYIFNNDILADNAIVAFECNHPIEVDETWFSKSKEYRYGEITVTVMIK